MTFCGIFSLRGRKIKNKISHGFPLDYSQYLTLKIVGLLFN